MYFSGVCVCMCVCVQNVYIQVYKDMLENHMHVCICFRDFIHLTFKISVPDTHL